MQNTKIVSPAQLASYIDHTLLKPETTSAQVVQLCEEAKRFGFATVCVYPRFISLAKKELTGSKVLPIAVVGFPTGLNPTEEKIAEATAAIRDGAGEIDMVINIDDLKNKQYALVLKDILSVVQTCGAIPVKVILETSELNEEEKIEACSLAVAGGAKFVKTSTGFKGGATREDVILMRQVVGRNIGVKASGGIRDYETAKMMIEAGANRLGTSNGVQIVQGLAVEKGDKKSRGY